MIASRLSGREFDEGDGEAINRKPYDTLWGASARAGPTTPTLFRLAVHVRSSFDGLAVAVPLGHWPGPVEGGIAGLIERLLKSVHLHPPRARRRLRGRTKRSVVKG